MSAPSFNNIGVNYAIAGANWASDAAYFKASRKYPAQKFPINIVCNNARVPIPWSLGTTDNNGNFADGRNAAIFFASDPAFDVTFNIWYGPTTADRYSDASIAMMAEATYLQTLGLPIEISVGNELTGSYGILFGGASITQTGGVATIIMPSVFQTHVGDTFTIYGSNHAEYNSVWTVVSYDGNRTVTFNCTSSFSSTASGTVISLSIAQLNVLIRNLATNIKSVYTAGKVSVAEYNGLVNGLYAYDDWVANGLGGLDHINIHVYPSLLGKPAYAQTIANSPNSNASLTMISTFGNRCYFGEFNLSGSSISFAPEAVINGTRRLYVDAANLGIKRVTIWSWNTNLGMINQTTRVYSPAWGIFVSGNARSSLAMYAQTRDAITSGRTPSPGRTPTTGRVAV